MGGMWHVWGRREFVAKHGKKKKNTWKTGLVVMVILKWILMNSEGIAWNGFFQLRISTWGGLF